MFAPAPAPTSLVRTREPKPSTSSGRLGAYHVPMMSTVPAAPIENPGAHRKMEEFLGRMRAEIQPDALSQGLHLANAQGRSVREMADVNLAIARSLMDKGPQTQDQGEDNNVIQEDDNEVMDEEESSQQLAGATGTGSGQPPVQSQPSVSQEVETAYNPVTSQGKLTDAQCQQVMERILLKLRPEVTLLIDNLVDARMEYNAAHPRLVRMLRDLTSTIYA